MTATSPSRTPLAPAVRDGMHRESRERVLREGMFAELLHVVLAAIVALLALGAVPTPILAGWFVVLSAAVVWRAVLRHDLERHALDAARRLRQRIAVGALGLTWGVGTGLFTRWIPFHDVALLLVIASGLVAAGTATLAADTVGFRTFLIGMLAPLGVGILVQPLDESRIVALALILVFAVAMFVLHRRAHQALVERVTANTQLAASEAQAARAHSHLQALFSSAPVATAVVTAGGIVEDVNPRFETLFGWPAAEAFGRALNDLIVPPEERSRALQLDGTVLGGETVVIETRRRHKNGALVPVRASAARIEGGAEPGLFVLYEDIADELAARNALEEARDAAEKVAQMRSAFLANMSHEIRTPMNAVMGLAELLLDSELTAEQRRMLGLIQTSGETLLTLLNDILDLSKIEADGLHLEEVPFDLRRLVDTTVSLMAVRAREHGIELLADVGPAVPEQVRGDPTRLRQVLTNLIGNAIKFTHEGEVVVSLRQESRADGTARIYVAVRDTGIGIPPEQREAIFQPFSQADLSMTRKYGGTGLGLTIARRLVGMMGGKLEVASEVGRGSEFSFTMSLAVEAAVPGPLPSPDAVALAGLRMLVVDDNASNRGIVRGLLGAAGVAVDEAEDAEQGLAAMRRAAAARSPYALAILDAQMPGRDGFELAEEARADPALAGTRLLMLTSAGQRGDAQRCRELGIRGYLTKPVSRADLLDMVAGVLGPGDGDVAGEVVTRHRIHESRRHLRILLAEDNAVNQEVAAAMLRKRGHTVEVVDNGRAALEKVQTEPFDVVLMDVQMPELDGLEATRAIRALPGGQGAALPIVALTAHAQADEGDRCLAAGMNAFVTKPFKAFELFSAAEGWGGGTRHAAESAPEPGPEAASPAVPPAEAGPPPVALDAFRKEMEEAGAGAAVEGIVAGFAEGAEARIVAVTAAAAAGDGDEVARLCHRMRSSSAQIGAHQLALLLAEMEDAAKQGEVEKMRDRAAEVRREATQVVEYLKKRG